MQASDYIEKMKNSFYELYDMFGMAPNCYLVSNDVISNLVGSEQQFIIDKTCKDIKIDGIPVQVVTGFGIAKAAYVGRS